ncbi:MAG: hypothetical protein WAM14_15420, partial [Candidatus Nitrosopolaris sp.]
FTIVSVSFERESYSSSEILSRTMHRAINLMNDVVKSGLSVGKESMGLAATVVYASCIGTGE